MHKGVMLMRKIKVAATVLAVSMLAGVFAGCSKTANISTEKFTKICEKMGLEEFEIDGEMPKPRDVEKGYYIAADGDEAEELIGSKFRHGIDDIASLTGIVDFIDPDDVESFGFAARVDGYKDLKRADPKELEDLEVDGAVAFQMTLDDNYSEDIMSCFTELLDKYDISTDDLSDKEFYSSPKEGYLRLHINVADFAEMVINNDNLDEYAKLTLNEDMEDLLSGLTGDIALSVEVNGANVLVVAGFSLNRDADTLKDFIKRFGVAYDPLKLPMNETVAETAVEEAGLAINAYVITNIASGDIIDDGGDVDIDGGSVDVDINGDSGFKVGISMPTQDLMRWYQDGSNLKEQLEENGYTVDLQYAGNTINTQVAQIENMINSGCKILVIAAIDGSSLTTVLEEAAAKGVKVIAYDRLIMATECVDYYVSFDNYTVGVLQATYIINALDIENNRGPFNIELTAGDPSDFNARLFYNGAYDVLSPYIASGQIKVVSGQTAFEDVATNGWKTDQAKARAENIISSYYSDGTDIDAWLCSNDSTAWGVIQALESTNYKGTYPIITGQDCDLVNVKSIIAGKQAMSVFKDTRTLVDQTAKMVMQIAEGEVVDVNDNSTHNNGVKTVPSYLCSPIFVDENNYKTILVDSGYYSETDFI